MKNQIIVRHGEGCVYSMIDCSGKYENGTYDSGSFPDDDENTSSSTRSKNAVIVGNGTESARSNAHTLDWNGNAEYAGDIKANACGGEAPISLKETNDLAVEDKARIDTLETLGLILLDGTINATFEVEDPEPAEISEDEEYYHYNNF